MFDYEEPPTYTDRSDVDVIFAYIERQSRQDFATIRNECVSENQRNGRYSDRDDGVGAGEYLEWLTYLLFLKMADELGKTMSAKYNWQTLKAKSGSELPRPVR